MFALQDAEELPPYCLLVRLKIKIVREASTSTTSTSIEIFCWLYEQMNKEFCVFDIVVPA